MRCARKRSNNRLTNQRPRTVTTGFCKPLDKLKSFNTIKKSFFFSYKKPISLALLCI